MPAWLQRDWCSSFVLALGHFVWQGTLIAVVLAIALRATKAVSVRYWLSLAALLVMAACPIVTLGWLMQPVSHVATLDPPFAAEEPAPSQLMIPPAPIEAASDVGQVSNLPVISPVPSLELKMDPSGRSPNLRPATDDRSWWQKFAPQLTTTYLCGVALMLLRLVFGLWGGRRLRRRVHLIDDPSLLAAMRRQATALGLKLLPVLAYCERVTVPTVVGVLKPMILLPLTLTSGLSPEQMESVLAHELAHLRRYDHLVNLLQRVIESLLFFHPALWWVSHRIRDEREHCCDDLVVACGAMPLDYAKSLLVVAELSRAGRGSLGAGRGSPDPALGSVAAVSLLATGNQKPSNLRQRIARLLGESATPSLRVSPRTLLLAIAIPVVAVIATIQSGASPHGSELMFNPNAIGVGAIEDDAADSKPAHADGVGVKRGSRAGRGSPDPALDPTAGLPNSDEETNPPNNANGDLRSNPAAGSGDPRRAQTAAASTREDPPGDRAVEKTQKRVAIQDVVRGVDFLRVKEVRFEEALLHTPELHVPDPKNPGTWDRPKNVFPMPLGEHTWLKYPAGSGHFYIEHRPDGSPESELLYGPIEGDPFEVLKLDDFFREKLKPDSNIVGSDPRYRLRLMFRTAEPSLMQRAWQFIEPVLSRKFSNRNEPGFFERLEILEIARDGLREQVAANKSAELVDLGQRMRDVIGAAEASVDALNDSVPDASYQSATYLQPKIQAQLPDALWGKPVSGLRLGLVPRKSGPDSEWDALPADASLPTTIKAKPGEPLHYRLMVENVSDAEIKFCGYVGGEEMARSVEILDHKGQPAKIDSLHTDIPHFISHWRLKPRERMLLTIPAIHFRPVSPDSPTKGLGYHVTAANGRYSLRCSYHFGDLDTSRQRHIPGKTEWIGPLTTGTQTITVGAGKNDDATANAAATAPPDGLEFLKPYPKLHSLSLDMTEPQFLAIVKQQELKTRKTVDGEKVTHHITLGDSHTLIVMFGEDAKCSGIQRVRGEDPAVMPPDIMRFSNKGRSAVSVQGEDDVRFMLYSHDVLRSGLTKTVLETGEWRIEGHVNLLKDGREVRRFNVKYTSQEPHTLSLDGKPIALDRLPKPDNTDGGRDVGHLFFLRAEGEVVQTGCVSGLKDASDLDPEKKWSLAYYTERNLYEEEASRINRKLFALDGWVIASDSQDATQHGSGARTAHLRVFPDGRVVTVAKDDRRLFESRVPREDVAAFVNWAIDQGGAGPRKASAVVIYRGKEVPIFVDPLPSGLWDQSGRRIAINRDGKTYDLLSIWPPHPERKDPAILRSTAGDLGDEAKERLEKLLALAKPSEEAPGKQVGDSPTPNANQSSPPNGLRSNPAAGSGVPR